MTTALSLEQVSYSYHTMKQETTALSSITFDVLSGEFVAVVGPSGCGKSTMLHLIAKLLPLSGGTIKINGVPIEESTDHIGYMLQKDQLLPWRTIYENVTLGLKIQNIKDPEAFDKVDRLLELYGLKDFKNSYPSQLSGGMRQRAALLRTYMFSKNVALLDEPFSALDTLTKSDMHRWYLDVMDKIHLSTLFITHDIDEAILLSDRIYLLTGRPGRITEEIVIREPKPRRKDFNLTEEFLEYKKDILKKL